MLKFIFDQIPGLIIGALVSGIACVLSAKYLGWFNKQIESIKNDVSAK